MNTVMQKEPTTAPAHRRERDTMNFVLPPVNIFETRDAYVIEAEMPGVNRDGLDITLENNTLVLSGYREQQAPHGEAVYLESKRAHFRRVFELEPTVDSNRIEAHLNQGLLTVSLPKAERVKPRKIAVTD